MSTHEQKQIQINIDSRFRNKNLYDLSTKFTVILEDTIRSAVSISISNIDIENSMFKNFIVTRNLYIMINTTSIIITPGNYTLNQLLYQIQSQLINITISICYDNKIEFEGLTDFTIEFRDKQTASMLGFYNLRYFSLLHSNGKYKINNDGVCSNLDGNYLFLKINDYGNIYTTINNDILQNTPIFTKLIINTDKSLILPNVSVATPKYIFKQLTNISKLDIELIDRFGNTFESEDNFSLVLNITYIDKDFG
jgi:hypothetical protein